MRSGEQVYYLHGDHLGSVSLVTNESGEVVSRQLYHPYGTVRYSEGANPTDFGFTGQKTIASAGLIFMNARFYHPHINRWISPDTIVPDLANPQSLNRYSYVRNRPLSRIDPSGHQDTPPPTNPEVIQQAIAYFESLGWQVVGDPTLVSENANGPDLVFIAEEGARVLAVEVKNVAGALSKGTLKYNAEYGDYGGSIARLARRSLDYYNSSNEQLRLMCQTTRDAYEAGTLENALYASSKATRISQGAQDLFNGVYRATASGEVEVEKALDEVATAAGAGASATTVWQAVKAWMVKVGSTPLPPIIVVPRFWFEDSPWYAEPQQG